MDKLLEELADVAISFMFNAVIIAAFLAILIKVTC